MRFFFLKVGSIVGHDLINLVKEFFQTRVMNQQVNKTLIMLLQKRNQPTNITHYRPFNLCNVSYKAISKILVYRMRTFIDCFILPFQAAFVPSR